MQFLVIESSLVDKRRQFPHTLLVFPSTSRAMAMLCGLPENLEKLTSRHSLVMIHIGRSLSFTQFLEEFRYTDWRRIQKRRRSDIRFLLTDCSNCTLRSGTDRIYWDCHHSYCRLLIFRHASLITTLWANFHIACNVTISQLGAEGQLRVLDADGELLLFVSKAGKVECSTSVPVKEVSVPVSLYQ